MRRKSRPTNATRDGGTTPAFALPSPQRAASTRSNAPQCKPTPNTRARKTTRLFAVHRSAVHRTTHFNALQRNPIPSIRARGNNSFLCQPSPPPQPRARAETMGITQPHPPETRARLTNGALSLYCSRKRAAAKGKDAFFFMSPSDFGAKTCVSFNPAVPARSGNSSNAGRGQFSPSSSASTSSRYFSNTFSTTLSSSTET